MANIMSLFSGWTQQKQVLTVAVTLAVVMIFRQGVVGYGFIEIGSNFAEGGTYALLDNVLPLSLWGVFYLINALLYIFAVFLAIRFRNSLLLIICGLIGGVLMWFYLGASWTNSTTKIHTYGYVITCTLHFFIAVLGGAATWLQKEHS